jgi:hypothetical protein
MGLELSVELNMLIFSIDKCLPNINANNGSVYHICLTAMNYYNYFSIIGNYLLSKKHIVKK